MFGGGPMHGMRNTRDEKAQDTGQTLRRLAGYMKPYWLQLLAVAALLVVGTLLQLAAPYLIGRAIDEFIAAADPRGLALTMLALLAAYLGTW